MAGQAALARTAALLRGTTHLAPRGVYRFSSHDDADADDHFVDDADIV